MDTRDVYRQNEDQGKDPEKIEGISIEAFSKLVGFPTEMIKKELFLEEENISLEELRSSVTKYLLSNVEKVEQ